MMIEHLGGADLDLAQRKMDGAGQVVLLVLGAGQDLYQLSARVDQPADIVASDLSRHRQQCSYRRVVPKL
jgi:hypothetical protein